MPNRLFRTPLIAAFFCAAITVGCTENQPPAQTGLTKCAVPTTAIASVQGSRPASPLLDQQLTIQGVVTLVQDGQGFYLEEPGSDNDAGTSNAVFVQSTEFPGDIGQGSWVSVHGQVTEIRKGRNSLTALTNVTDISQCSSGQALPLSKIALPLRGLEREALEGMRIQAGGTLTVTDTYQLGRGKFSLAGNGFQFTATEKMTPGPEAEKHARENRNFTLPATLPEKLKYNGLLASGSVITDLTGVLTHG